MPYGAVVGGAEDTPSACSDEKAPSTSGQPKNSTVSSWALTRAGSGARLGVVETEPGPAAVVARLGLLNHLEIESVAAEARGRGHVEDLEQRDDAREVQRHDVRSP